MTTPANALFGPVWVDSAGNSFVSPDGGKTWAAAPLAAGDIPLATPTANGLMSAAQFLALSGAPASMVLGVTLFAYSDVIDLKQTGPFVLVPPTPARLVQIQPQWEVKSVNTCTVSPTYSIGSNSSSFNNLHVSGTTSAFTTAVAEQMINVTSLVSPVTAVDISTSGLQVNVTGGATATALTARMYISFVLLPI